MYYDFFNMELYTFPTPPFFQPYLPLFISNYIYSIRHFLLQFFLTWNYIYTFPTPPFFQLYLPSLFMGCTSCCKTEFLV